MAALEVNTFGLSEDQISELSPDGTQIKFRVEYDTEEPAGWQIVAQGPVNSLIVCPKPCPKIKIPV